jgi:hypothetical protein
MFGALRSDDVVEPGKLELQHIAIQEQQRV